MLIQKSDPKSEPWSETLGRLIQKLNLFADLKEALNEGGHVNHDLLANRVRTCRLAFRQAQKQWKVSENESKDLENLLSLVEAAAPSASPEQLSLLAKETHRRAIEMLRSFADSLLMPQKNDC
jgi:hypothetical protein